MEKELEKKSSENQYYKELRLANVGIDYVILKDGREGYVFFVENESHTETFYEDFDSAWSKYNNAEKKYGDGLKYDK